AGRRSGGPGRRAPPRCQAEKAPCEPRVSHTSPALAPRSVHGLRCRRFLAWRSTESVLPLILRRLLATIPVMGVVALFVFALLRLTPGDPAAIIAGDYATPQ